MPKGSHSSFYSTHGSTAWQLCRSSPALYYLWYIFCRTLHYQEGEFPSSNVRQVIGIWRRCLEQDSQVPTPVGRGWVLDDGQLIVDWKDGQPA